MADGDTDSYWPMQKNMTVFGFGRKGLAPSLGKAPARFTVLLSDAKEAGEIRTTMEGLTSDVRVTVGKAELAPGR